MKNCININPINERQVNHKLNKNNTQNNTQINPKFD